MMWSSLESGLETPIQKITRLVSCVVASVCISTVLVEHLTHFTDWLGASHSRKYMMWGVGDIATDGLKEIAEWGNTYTGEGEMKGNVSLSPGLQVFTAFRQVKFEQSSK